MQNVTLSKALCEKTTSGKVQHRRRPLSTSKASGNEIANVNFFYHDIFNHFYAVLPGSYRIRRNNAK